MSFKKSNYTDEQNTRRQLKLDAIALRLQNKLNYNKQMRDFNRGYTKAKPPQKDVLMESITKSNSEGHFYEKLSALFNNRKEEVSKFGTMYLAKYGNEKEKFTLYNMVHNTLMSQFSKIKASAELVFKTIIKLYENFDNTVSFS